MQATSRWILTVVLAAVASLLALMAIVARYARSELLDTDRYVAAVEPLASDPAVQDLVAARVSDRIVGRLDVEDLTTEALEALVHAGAPGAVTGLAGPIADQVESFVRIQVRRLVASDTFAELWTGMHRAAHDQIAALLTDDDQGAVQVEDGAVVLDLGTVVAAVKVRLLDRGLTFAERIPEDLDAELTIVESTRLERAQRGVRVLDRAAIWLPWLVLGVGTLAVLVAPDRCRALLLVAGGIALAMVLVAASLALARNWFLEHGAGDDVTKEAARRIAPTVLAPLPDVAARRARAGRSRRPGGVPCRPIAGGHRCPAQFWPRSAASP